MVFYVHWVVGLGLIMQLKNKNSFTVLALVSTLLLITFHLFEIVKILVRGFSFNDLLTPVCVIILLSLFASTFYEKK